MSWWADWKILFQYRIFEQVGENISSLSPEWRVEEGRGEGGVVGHGVVQHVGQGPGAGAGVLTEQCAGLRQRPERGQWREVWRGNVGRRRGASDWRQPTNLEQAFHKICFQKIGFNMTKWMKIHFSDVFTWKKKSLFLARVKSRWFRDGCL